MFEVTKEDNFKPFHLRWNSIIPIGEDYFLDLKNKNVVETKENINLLYKFIVINQIEYMNEIKDEFKNYNEWNYYFNLMYELLRTPICYYDSSSLYIGSDDPEFMKQINKERKEYMSRYI